MSEQTDTGYDMETSMRPRLPWGVRLTFNVITGLLIWGWLAWRDMPSALETAAACVVVLTVMDVIFGYVWRRVV